MTPSHHKNYSPLMIQFFPGNERATFIVYRLDLTQSDGFTQPLHVGCLPLASLATYEDAKARAGWSDRIDRSDRLTLTILGQSDVRETAEAMRLLHEAATVPRPAFADAPVRPPVPSYQRGTIQCVETGETWSSAAALARELGVDPSAVSQHLSARTKTLQGRTYIRTAKDADA